MADLSTWNLNEVCDRSKSVKHFIFCTSKIASFFYSVHKFNFFFISRSLLQRYLPPDFWNHELNIRQVGRLWKYYFGEIQRHRSSPPMFSGIAVFGHQGRVSWYWIHFSSLCRTRSAVLFLCLASSSNCLVRFAGIAPKNLDWDISNCIRFKDLVYEKVLISFVVDVGAEKASMVLFDSSMGSEVDIGAQLVGEGHAVDITERL